MQPGNGLPCFQSAVLSEPHWERLVWISAVPPEHKPVGLSSHVTCTTCERILTQTALPQYSQLVLAHAILYVSADVKGMHDEARHSHM